MFKLLLLLLSINLYSANEVCDSSEKSENALYESSVYSSRSMLQPRKLWDLTKGTECRIFTLELMEALQSQATSSDPLLSALMDYDRKNKNNLRLCIKELEDELNYSMELVTVTDPLVTIDPKSVSKSYLLFEEDENGILCVGCYCSFSASFLESTDTLIDYAKKQLDNPHMSFSAYIEEQRKADATFLQRYVFDVQNPAKSQASQASRSKICTML